MNEKEEYNLYGDRVTSYSIPVRNADLVGGGNYDKHVLFLNRSDTGNAEEKEDLQTKKQVISVLNERGRDDIKISSVSSIGICENEPSAVVYPDDVWYRGLTATDAEKVAHQHLAEGEPVAELAVDPGVPEDHIHIVVCTFLAACGPQGGGKAFRYFKRRARNRTDIHVSQARSCLWDCSMGPIAVVYPQGNWYPRLAEHKFEDIWEAEANERKKSKYSV